MPCCACFNPRYRKSCCADPTSAAGMVRACAFPSCSNKMTKRRGLGFYSLPVFTLRASCACGCSPCGWMWTHRCRNSSVWRDQLCPSRTRGTTGASLSPRKRRARKVKVCHVASRAAEKREKKMYMLFILWMASMTFSTNNMIPLKLSQTLMMIPHSTLMSSLAHIVIFFLYLQPWMLYPDLWILSINTYSFSIINLDGVKVWPCICFVHSPWFWYSLVSFYPPVPAWQA